MDLGPALGSLGVSACYTVTVGNVERVPYVLLKLLGYLDHFTQPVVL